MSIIYDKDSREMLLVHFDGGDGQTESSGNLLFPDFGATGHAVQGAGIGQTTGYFGQHCASFNGSSDFLYAPNHADFNIQTDFTIELLVKHLQADNAQSEVYLQQWEDSNNYWHLFRVGAGEGLQFERTSSGSTYVQITTATLIIQDIAWHHIVLSKVADEYGIYLDGVQVGYLSESEAHDITGALIIGKSGANNSYFGGTMDEIRIYHGNPFGASPDAGLTDTITRATAQYVSDANTKLLLHCESMDSSNIPHSLEWYGATLDTTIKYFGLSSCEFNGSSDYIDIGDHNDWYLNADFTIELRVYLDPSGGDNCFMSQGTTESNCMMFGSDGSNGVYFNMVGTSVQQSVGYLNNEQWYHVAVIKRGNDWGIYVDGVQVGYLSSSYSYPDFVADLSLGFGWIGGSKGRWFGGHMDELRIFKGAAFGASPNVGLTDTITPLTVPYGTWINNTRPYGLMELQSTPTIPTDETFDINKIINAGEFEDVNMGLHDYYDMTGNYPVDTWSQVMQDSVFFIEYEATGSGTYTSTFQIGYTAASADITISDVNLPTTGDDKSLHVTFLVPRLGYFRRTGSTPENLAIWQSVFKRSTD